MEYAVTSTVVSQASVVMASPALGVLSRLKLTVLGGLKTVLSVALNWRELSPSFTVISNSALLPSASTRLTFWPLNSAATSAVSIPLVICALATTLPPISKFRVSTSTTFRLSSFTEKEAGEALAPSFSTIVF